MGTRKNEFRFSLVGRLRNAFDQSRHIKFLDRNEEKIRMYALARRGEEILINRYESFLESYEEGEIDNEQFSMLELVLICGLYVTNEMSRKKGLSNIQSQGLIPTPFMDNTIKYFDHIKEFYQSNVDHVHSLQKVKESEIVASQFYQMLISFLDEFKRDKIANL
jgi:hypothetical protein